jgi:tRNA A-37 threonylcarbamoyl transferase component Bud32
MRVMADSAERTIRENRLYAEALKRAGVPVPQLGPDETGSSVR